MAEHDVRGHLAAGGTHRPRLTSLGVHPGHVVGVLDWNHLRHFELYWAIPGTGAERTLRDALSTRTAPAGELVTAETRLIDLADLWINGLEAEGRIEQTTINEYRRVLDNLVLPSVGGLKLREATTGRLDRLLLKLRDQSVNRQRKAKVVLGAMLDIAVRHDAIPVNPCRATSRVHSPRQETKALRVEDLVEIRAAVRRSVDAVFRASTPPDSVKADGGSP